MKRVILVALLLVGCAAQQRTFTPNQKSYLDRANATALKFSVPKSQAHDAWGRAQAFVAQHATMKIQTATDFVLETYNVTDANNVGYSLSQTPLGDSCLFSVECHALWYVWEHSPREIEDVNGHCLAYYIKTGEAPPDGLILP